MIPKIIHYCWFGGKPIPDKLKRYMASWKKQLPDYQVMEWNENNFDVYSHPFVKEAYEKRKFAFVSDYVRIFALYNYGGIYLDTDVEVCKTFDMILGYKGFVSMEPETNLISTCCIGFEKKHPLAKNILQSYDTLKLDGTPNTVLFYNLIKNEYSGFNGDNVECDFGDIHIFSSKFISLSKKYLDNYIIHYLSATWLSPWNRFKQKIILVALKNKTTATMYKCYKKLVGGGKKIIFHGLKLLVSFVNYLSPRIATAMFIKVLKFCGVNINGTPRFISTRIRIDEFSLISIGHNSVISENVVLLTHDYSCTNALRTLNVLYSTDVSKHAPIEIGNNVFIGLGSVILPGTEIEDNVIIGAGSVVKGHLKSDMIYVGNPIKSIKEINKYAAKIQDEMRSGLYDYRFD